MTWTALFPAKPRPNPQDKESAERIRYLELAAIRMRADLAYFVKRCDRGEVRSCATQARFRATLDAIPEIVQSPPRF